MKPNFRHPKSRLILPASAPEKDWLAQRKLGIGGSDVSAILGLTPWSSPYEVWLDKTGRGKPREVNGRMRFGKMHEATMRAAFTEDTGIPVHRQGLHQYKDNPIFQVTPDGFTADGGFFEAKTGSYRVLEDWSDDQVADHAALQVSYGMGVTGREFAHVCVLVDGWNFQIRRYQREDAMIAELFSYLDEWWFKYVVKDVEPPITSAALPAIKDQWSLADEEVEMPATHPGAVIELLKLLNLSKQREKAAKREAEQIEAQLRHAAAGAAIVTDGEKPLFTLRNDGTLSTKRLAGLLSPEQIDGLMVLKRTLDLETLKDKYPNEYTAARARVLRSQVK
jgi:putative phage-type endonuclease